jgi:phosphodiesterase/alkaline phosphatase D-like protein
MSTTFPDGELTDAAELGAVDCRSVRIWVRQPDAERVDACLEVEDRPAITETIRLSADTDWTGAVTLNLPDPAPGSRFVCTAGSRRLSGRLSPLPETHAGLIFGFGSCNLPFRATDDGVRVSDAAGIYPAIREELLRENAAFMLLLGDQIYSDGVASLSVRDHLSGDLEHPPPLDEALAAYRRVTRGYLGQAGFRALRAALPTYCMWDDHEIFDSWGSRLEKTPLDRRLFEAAGRAYCEYQHQRNPNGAIGPPPYHYTFRHGDIGFLVLDVRGARDYEHGRLLGEAQWLDVERYLAGDDAASLHTLFVVTSVPIAHVSRWMGKFLDDLPGANADAVRDRWCSNRFVGGRNALLDHLFDWEAAAPARQVILLSGDVHAASAFTIRRRKGLGVIRQFTSSAMTTPSTPRQRTLNRIAVQFPNLFEPRFHFERHLLSFPNNYGFVRVVPLPDGGHRVGFSVRSWHPEQGQLKTAAGLIGEPDPA